MVQTSQVGNQTTFATASGFSLYSHSTETFFVADIMPKSIARLRGVKYLILGLEW